MKNSIAVGVVVLGVIVSAGGQGIVIDSFDRNGSITSGGAQVGSTATVEWAASLTEPGRTNWHTLSAILVPNDTMTPDVPVFFRVRGYPLRVSLPVKAGVRPGGNDLHAATHIHIVYI
jgi:hypothetical protein